MGYWPVIQPLNIYQKLHSYRQAVGVLNTSDITSYIACTTFQHTGLSFFEGQGCQVFSAWPLIPYYVGVLFFIKVNSFETQGYDSLLLNTDSISIYHLLISVYPVFLIFLDTL